MRERESGSTYLPLGDRLQADSNRDFIWLHSYRLDTVLSLLFCQTPHFPGVVFCGGKGGWSLGLRPRGRSLRLHPRIFRHVGVTQWQPGLAYQGLYRLFYF